MMATKLTCDDGHAVELRAAGGAPERVHVFEQREIDAVNAALMARRPLLVRGEPGTGKTQLAEAVAVELKRAFVARAIDASTEPRDLLYEVDAVARLGQAQLLAALPRSTASRTTVARDELDIRKFVRPQALWWAFDWASAREQAKLTATPPPAGAGPNPTSYGTVALIDEIDKAESDVPNALLEALGVGEFTPPGWDAPITAKPPTPLVIVTTNEERALPDAFVRRCLVLPLDLPRNDEELKRHLERRGARHFPKATEAVLSGVAAQLVTDRADARSKGLRPLPGQAEYLDLVRALIDLFPGDERAQLDHLARIARFFLQKHETGQG